MEYEFEYKGGYEEWSQGEGRVKNDIRRYSLKIWHEFEYKGIEGIR